MIALSIMYLIARKKSKHVQDNQNINNPVKTQYV